MKTVDYYKFKVPDYYLPAIVNGDITGLEEDELKKLHIFLEQLNSLTPENCIHVISVESEEPYFSHTNDLHALGCNVVDLKVSILEH